MAKVTEHLQQRNDTVKQCFINNGTTVFRADYSEETRRLASRSTCEGKTQEQGTVPGNGKGRTELFQRKTGNMSQ